MPIKRCGHIHGAERRRPSNAAMLRQMLAIYLLGLADILVLCHLAKVIWP